MSDFFLAFWFNAHLTYLHWPFKVRLFWQFGIQGPPWTVIVSRSNKPTPTFQEKSVIYIRRSVIGWSIRVDSIIVIFVKSYAPLSRKLSNVTRWKEWDKVWTDVRISDLGVPQESAAKAYISFGGEYKVYIKRLRAFELFSTHLLLHFLIKSRKQLPSSLSNPNRKKR